MTGLDLSKQVGPLPLGAWVVVVAGGLGIAYYTRGHSASADTTPVDDTSSPAGVGDGSVGGWTSTSAGTQTSDAASAPTTNEEWAYRATAYLIGIGTPSTTAQSATSKYIAEQQLSVAEYSLIALSLIAIGPLPSPLSNAGSTAPPATTVKLSAPAALKASSVGRTSATLDWTPVSGAHGYRFFVNGKQSGVAIVYSKGTIYSLKPKTKYTLGVCAIDGSGTNGPIATIPVTTKK